MDLENNSFGSGPRELGGAVDLISQYKLWPHHEFFCKRTLPLSLLETHYLRNVVGNTEIKRGEGMELDQLFRPTSNLREKGARITTFDLEILSEAFHMRDSTPIDLSSAEKGNPTSRKLKGESKGKERKHRKHKDRHKDKFDDKDEHRSGHHDYGLKHSKKQQDMKRRHDGSGDLPDIRKHKKRQVVEEIVE
ncbi:hypothetical protein Ddye_024774 [Dipteronia dyeriana]|uniref:Mediator of RNA polymerase II transcription subunit 19 n=1 Tax=Dipteronia dyeriana TaxID=168575 RepID=A0AAD9TW22_9ROSI|nr:hypothetical protein Ddye_024774 [Dipteronia dyeriana]